MGRMLMNLQRPCLHLAIGRHHRAQGLRRTGLQIGHFGQNVVTLMRHVSHGFGPFAALQHDYRLRNRSATKMLLHG